MKTKLPKHITSREEAESLLYDLYNNGEQFHPEDDPFDVEWETAEVSQEEKQQLKVLMDDIYNLPEMADYPKNKWDPCGYLLDLHYQDHPEQL